MNFSNDESNDNEYINEIDGNSVASMLQKDYGNNSNILNRIYYINNKDYQKLMDYLKKFELLKDSEVKSNMTCPGKRYFIQDMEFMHFCGLLMECVNKNLILHFREMQVTDMANRIGSGIMFDFDLFQESETNTLKSKKFLAFLKRMYNIIKKVVKINDNDSVHMVVTCKQNMKYIEDKKMYKNGFHVLIPSIQIPRQAKKLIYNELINDPGLQDIYRKEFNNELKDTFDAGSYSVPVFFMHNCKESSTEPYILTHFYHILNDEDGVQLEQVTEDEYKNYNLISELSLNFKSILIKKRYYDLHDKYLVRIQEAEAQSYKFEDEKEHVTNTFNTYESYIDEYLTYYKTLVMEVLDIKRATDRNMWRDTIFAIANINPGVKHAFKPIAEMFSMRNEQKWDKVEFEKIWNEAISNNSENKLSFNSIAYWAIRDNGEKFEALKNKDILSCIELDVYNSENRLLNGTLYQHQLARYLYHLFKLKFVYDENSGGKGSWFEFVLENDAHSAGELSKWRNEDDPESLKLFLSNKLTQHINKVIVKAENRMRNNPENEKENEYVLKRTNNLRKSAVKLYDNSFKKAVIEEAKLFFRCRGFIKKLNSDQNIFGVGNGVLELSESPKLINYYHNYPISLYTETNYVPYDKHNPNVKRILKVILDLFPDDEIDAFHYIMYYLASCLDGKPKDSMILILTGCGCHSIDTPIIMYDGSIKKVQDVQINDKLMGDDNTPRIVQELFRGRDQMVRIKPIKGDSFIVNINHILSLKNIKNKKIYDIKVKNLLKYDNNVSKDLYLYKSDKSTHKFEIELLEEDNYYGFELDQNHRYLTGDYYVHHNSNGKSFFAEMVKSIMGQYGAKMAMSFLTESRGRSSGADEQLMLLKNARLAYYSETDKNEVLNTAKLKEITSQETLSGRGIYEKQTNFRPMCSHMVTTNYQFSVKTTDHGIWRRLKTYEFKNKFDDNPDPNNKYEKKNDPTIAKEFSFNPGLKEAFLSILVEYYKDLYINHNGMLKNIDKPSIDKETAEYRNKEDIMNRFIDEYCIFSPNSKTCLSELIDKYEQYYENNISKNHVPEKLEISNQLSNSKIVKYFKKGMNKVVLQDIRIKDDLIETDELNDGEYFLSDIVNNKPLKEFSYDNIKFNPLKINLE